MSIATENLLSSIYVGEEASDGAFSRVEGDNPSVTVRFVITGADDASTAYVALLDWLHTNYDDGFGGIASYDIPLSSIKIDGTTSPVVFRAECAFAFPSSDAETNEINNSGYQLPDIQDSDYSFSTTGHTSHITHSRQTLAYPATGETARDFDNGIGWNGESFDGCDVVSPTVQFSISVSLPQTWFSSAYRLAIASATGAVNSAAWDGFAAGCVLFRGVSAKPVWFTYADRDGNQRKNWYWRATYSFEAAQSASITFGGQTFTKRGFDYLWKLAEKSENETSGQLETSVVQVNLERVYPEFNFALLGLPLPD